MSAKKLLKSEKVTIHRPCRAIMSAKKLLKSEKVTIHWPCREIMRSQGGAENAKKTPGT